MIDEKTKTIKPTYHYDSETDILYISFADDEPTYTENVDDILCLETGWFSGIIKGVRILGLCENFKKI